MKHKNYVFILYLVVCLFLGYIILTKKEIPTALAVMIIMSLFVVIIHVYFYLSKKTDKQEKYDFFNRKRREDHMNRLRDTRDFDLESDFGDITETRVLELF